ncbi:hypothetical protein JYT84_00755 [bacterium AH-315-M10]|nr:hypothetical protein [bacterium AH-315-M10]
MSEGVSPEGRSVLQLAEREARIRWQDHVGPEHLLIALARKADLAPHGMLRQHRERLMRLGRRLRTCLPSNNEYPGTKELPLNKAAKACLRLATTHARDSPISAEQILIGLLEQDQDLRPEAFAKCGFPDDLLEGPIWPDPEHDPTHGADLISAEQIQEALRIQKQRGGQLGQILVDLGFVSADEMLFAQGAQAGMDVVNLDDAEIPFDVVSRISASIANRYRVVPVSFEDDTLVVAMSDPLNVNILDDLRLMLDCDVEGAVSNEDQLSRAIDKYYA